MQKNILIAIFAILFLVIVAIFVLIFEFDKKQDGFVFSKENHLEQEQKEPKANTWMHKLAKSNSLDYHFPVNDLLIKIDLKPNVKVSKTFYTSYNLIIDNFDRYSMFCIKQVFDMFKTPYVIVNEKNKNTIIVQSENSNNLVNVVEELKKYDIKSKIKEVKYEKNSNM